MKSLPFVCLLVAAHAALAQHRPAAKKPLAAQPKPVATVAHTPPVSGPTKEQTVQFIKDYFADIEFEDCSEKVEDGFNSYTCDMNSVAFDADNKTMTFSWGNNLYVSSEKTNLWFKFNVQTSFPEMEAIKIVSRVRKGCDTRRIYLELIAAPGSKFSVTKSSSFIEAPRTTYERSVEIPINTYTCDDCDNEDINKKIIQAFNHLRKLWGAPEPISFEEK